MSVLEQKRVSTALSEIETYLNQSNFFDKASQEWHEVPKLPKAETELYKPFGRVFNEITQYFNLPSGRLRSAMAPEKLGHHESEDATFPGFFITGCDEHFSRVIGNTNQPGFASAVSCIEARLDKHLAPRKKHHAEMSEYAR